MDFYYKLEVDSFFYVLKGTSHIKLKWIIEFYSFVSLIFKGIPLIKFNRFCVLHFSEDFLYKIEVDYYILFFGRSFLKVCLI